MTMGKSNHFFGQPLFGYCPSPIINEVKVTIQQ